MGGPRRGAFGGRIQAVRLRWRRTGIFLFAVAALSGAAPVDAALTRMEADGHLLYYPREEAAIARRLADDLPAMCRFLESHRLPVKAPVHIVLDDELDAPQPRVHVIPHREIRIPLRAPGVFEEGWLEADPWRTSLFKGLCLQAIFGMRSGLPGLAHKGFGEIVSPNVILPDWIIDGVCHFLYTRYRPLHPPDPIDAAIFAATPIPELAAVSNHSERWPGYYSYRIYGRPFIRWIVESHGWEALHGFLGEHGRGVIPIEIDLKAAQWFGATWAQLWGRFQRAHPRTDAASGGTDIVGYWPAPFIHWNRNGVFPGLERIAARSRYGYLDERRALWLSQTDATGVSKLVRYTDDQPVRVENESVWDPGPGGVAVSRKGHRPCLVRIPDDVGDLLSTRRLQTRAGFASIPGPDGVIQLSGPVMHRDGQIAVAGNRGGNWDIWLYDGGWRRLTEDPAAEIDPWFDGETLLYATNRDGVFRIVDLTGDRRSACATPAVMPRGGTGLCLAGGGWDRRPLLPVSGEPTAGRDPPAADAGPAPADTPPTDETPADPPSAAPHRPYVPWPSLMPNYLRPELFFSDTDLQVGVATAGRDVTGDYTLDGGVRYSTENEYWSLRAGASAMGVGLRYTRYPFAYTTALDQSIDESRHEIKAYWSPWQSEKLEFSLNYRAYAERRGGTDDDEAWAAVHLADTYGRLGAWMDAEWFSDGSRSLYGGGRLLTGESTIAMLHIQAGKSWGPLSAGHNTFRIGGNLLEGYFTQRPSRLFPVRGFDTNVLDAGEAAAAGFELFWPLANLQAGYLSLPLFLHRLMLGFFVDAGAAADPLAAGDVLVGGGVELVTSMEIAWGNFSSFRLGLAWPLHQPEGIHQRGPVFLIQLGKPL